MKNYIKLWLAMIIVYALDCLIITPYILYNSLGTETGLLMCFGFGMIGLIWFPIWFVVFTFLSLYGLKWFDKTIDNKCKKHSIYPKVAILFTWYFGMIGVIINNLRFIY